MELKQAFWILRHGSGEGLREYLKAIKTIEDNCVSVVRCKDCKHSYITVDARCCSYGAFYDVAVQDDFFCALAERKDVNER